MDEKFQDTKESLEQLEAEIWGENQAMRSSRTRKERIKLALRIVGISAVILLFISGVCGAFYLGMLVERNTPVTTVMTLKEYYAPRGDEVVVFQDTQRADWTAREVRGQVYLPLEIVQEMYLERLYVDEYDQLVMFTTPTEVYAFPIGDRAYTINEKPELWDQPVIREMEGDLWFALDYLQQEVDLYATYHEGDGEIAPGRLVLFTQDNVLLQKEVRGDTQIRTKADVKGDILKELSPGEKLWILEAGVNERFDKVMSKDGVIGYRSEERRVG